MGDRVTPACSFEPTRGSAADRAESLPRRFRADRASAQVPPELRFVLAPTKHAHKPRLIENVFNHAVAVYVTAVIARRPLTVRTSLSEWTGMQASCSGETVISHSSTWGYSIRARSSIESTKVTTAVGEIWFMPPMLPSVSKVSAPAARPPASGAILLDRHLRRSFWFRRRQKQVAFYGPNLSRRCAALEDLRNYQGGAPARWLSRGRC